MLGEVISHENIPEGNTKTHKCSFFPCKQVSGRIVIRMIRKASKLHTQQVPPEDLLPCIAYFHLFLLRF